MTKQRDSGLEMLRIFAMLQIIVLHAFNFGGITSFSNSVGGEFLTVANLVWSFCRTPVNVFLLITGYFAVESQFSIRKKIHQAGNVYKLMIFYSVVLSVVSWIIKPARILKETKTDFFAEILKSITPFLSRTWYYLTLYIIIILLAPFVNIALQKITKKQYMFLLGFCFFITSIWPVLAELKYTNKFISVKSILNVAEGKSVYSFLFMYMTGGFIKRFMPKRGKLNFLYLLAFAALCLTDFAMTYAKIKYKEVFGWYSNPLVILESVCLLLFFREFKFHNKGVNIVAKATLGVYMIHEFRYVREHIWKEFNFRLVPSSDIPMYYLKLAGVVVLIFSVCTVIELMRELLFGLTGRLYHRAVRKPAKLS